MPSGIVYYYVFYVFEVTFTQCCSVVDVCCVQRCLREYHFGACAESAVGVCLHVDGQKAKLFLDSKNTEASFLPFMIVWSPFKLTTS